MVVVGLPVVVVVGLPVVVGLVGFGVVVFFLKVGFLLVVVGFFFVVAGAFFWW